ncbi:MAG: type II toxin-antitoxin system VapC family toxin [Opitutales bacterium]
MFYLDTSALLKLYVLERGSEAIQHLVESSDLPLPVWEIQEMELINALRLKLFRGELEVDDVDHQIDCFDDRKRRGLYFCPEIDRRALRRSFRDFSRHTTDTGCRTMDILHVACAFQIRDVAFVSFDDRQCNLAERVGLEVVSRPGS